MAKPVLAADQSLLFFPVMHAVVVGSVDLGLEGLPGRHLRTVLARVLAVCSIHGIWANASGPLSPSGTGSNRSGSLAPKSATHHPRPDSGD
uniref:Putative secreted protein n=1 Tax=Anopheles triannulatus TaxID=58253 RepID=A0A2M4B4P4_9DIPT